MHMDRQLVCALATADKNISHTGPQAETKFEYSLNGIEWHWSQRFPCIDSKPKVIRGVLAWLNMLVTHSLFLSSIISIETTLFPTLKTVIVVSWIQRLKCIFAKLVAYMFALEANICCIRSQFDSKSHIVAHYLIPQGLRIVTSLLKQPPDRIWIWIKPASCSIAEFLHTWLAS